ncbi:hypothetical protein H4J58_01130 [Colwellia sp. MB3u-70]|uniref:hypothetical protein n=1 Tax=unclassified Colwellia TaxID=196834 RepID=UPI0015F47E43|nr:MULTISPECIES: hypothetical protein [unclassified Colwellia]MBA6292236.1 hypothetical protein [Colwellia sp. MB3u-8]MBA6305742.1 hypothetical protein [Colwellia sp. MB3u-70]
MLKKLLYKVLLFTGFTASIGVGVYAANFISNIEAEAAKNIEVQVKSDLENRKLCTVSDASKAYLNCSDGDIVLFTPERWGNEQFPIKIAAYICNFDKPIVHNKSAVACVFTSARG